MEDESQSSQGKGKRPTRVADDSCFPRARKALKRAGIFSAQGARDCQAYVTPLTDEDGWTENGGSRAGSSFARLVLGLGGALALICIGAVTFHMVPAVGSWTNEEGTIPLSDSVVAKEIPVDLSAVTKEARQYLTSSDVREMHRIHSVSGPASVLQIEGTDYLLQPVRLTDGIQRTAYFAITESGVEFDRASFVGDTDQRWTTLAMTDGGAEGDDASITGGETFGPCRLYVRPADYFNFQFSSPEKFICFKLDDAERQLSAYGYAPRESAVARDLERVFGADALSSTTGLATERRWTAHSLTLELSIPDQAAPNQFLINRILSDCWLLASATQQE